MRKILTFLLSLGFVTNSFAGSKFTGLNPEFLEQLALRSEIEMPSLYNSPGKAPLGVKYINPRDGKSYVRIDDMVFKLPETGQYAFESGVTTWPNGVLVYEFDRISSRNQRVFHEGCNLWGKRANVKCVERTNERNYVLVGEYGGNYSSVGMQGGQQELSMYNWDLDTVAHEVMHAFGFNHEQCRDDRDNYVEIVWNNINSGLEYNFYKDGSSTTSYDYYSVMHYDAYAFSNNGRQTIVPLDRSVDIRRMGYSPISDLDYKDMISVYGSNGTGPGPDPDPGPIPDPDPDPENPSPIDPGDAIPSDPGTLEITSWGDINSDALVIKGKASSRSSSTVEVLFDFGDDFPYIYRQASTSVRSGDNFTVTASLTDMRGPRGPKKIKFVLVHLNDSQDDLLARDWKWIKKYPNPGPNPGPIPTPDPDPVGEALMITSWGNLSGNQITISGKVNAANASFVSLYFDRSGEGMKPETFEWVSNGDTFTLTAARGGPLKAIYVILFDSDKNVISRLRQIP